MVESAHFCRRCTAAVRQGGSGSSLLIGQSVLMMSGQSAEGFYTASAKTGQLTV